MPHYCCAGECNNHSERAPKHVSFHKLLLEDKKLLKVWITKIRRDPRYFSPNMHTKICSEHFKEDDFIFADASKRRLKPGVIPSVFKWTKRMEVETLMERKQHLVQNTRPDLVTPIDRLSLISLTTCEALQHAAPFFSLHSSGIL